MQSWFVNSDPDIDDTDRFRIYMAHNPNGISTKSILHYVQTYKEQRFQVWAPDYNTNFFNIGEERKTELIELTNRAQVPIAMFVFDRDKMSNVVDAQRTMQQLGPSVIHF